MALRRRVVLPILVLCAAGAVVATVSVAAPTPAAPPTLAKGKSLAQAASKPHGIGARDLKPKGIIRSAIPKPALNLKVDKRGNRVSIQGCLLDYGAGDMCLPAVPPSAAAMGMNELTMPWTCAEVRTLLPEGIKVSGTDVLRLDTNQNEVACDAKDQ